MYHLQGENYILLFSLYALVFYFATDYNKQKQQTGQKVFSLSYVLYAERRKLMKKIASFTVDHIRLDPGIYVSRKDTVNDAVITTFDIRMTSPNDEPVMNTAEVHTIEHLGATFLRNHDGYQDKVIYFGPMGCRTGFYLLLAGDCSSADIVPLMKEMFSFIASYEGEIPGAAAKDCGNCLDMNLPMAKYMARRYLTDVLTDISDSRLHYPE